MNNSKICQYLSWDSEFFGIDIGRVTKHRLDEPSLLDIKKWCKSFNINCLYFLADSNHPNTIRLAEGFGFQLVDIRVSLRCDLTDWQLINPRQYTSPLSLRIAKKDDIPQLRNIARQVYNQTRFFADPNFDKDKCGEMYEIWIQKSIEGLADIVWVAEDENLPCGYVSCHILKESPQARIGLVGIGLQFQGKGVGQALIHKALNWCNENGIESVSVVTQGSNINAQRLYQRCGFRSESIQLWYHKWWNMDNSR